MAGHFYFFLSTYPDYFSLNYDLGTQKYLSYSYSLRLRFDIFSLCQIPNDHNVFFIATPLQNYGKIKNIKDQTIMNINNEDETMLSRIPELHQEQRGTEPR